MELHRVLILAAFCALPGVANYPNQQSVLLDVGARSLTLNNSGSGGSNPYTISCGASGSDRCAITVTPIYIFPAAPTYATCANPCALSFNRNFGQAYYVAEIVNSSGTPYAPRKVSGMQVIPQIEPAAALPGNWTFPIEAVGQDNYAQHVQANIPAGVATAGLRLHITGANLGYQAQSPVDGKCSVQVNSAAWQAISDANITAIDEAKYYGGIGSAPPVRDFTLPVADGTITASSTAAFGFRFNGTDGVTSGCRFLNFNLIEPNVQIDSVAVTSNVATVTTHTAHGYTSGNWVYVFNAPGPWGRFNGDRQITVTDSTHFTFTPCTVVDMLACTSPNGTFTVPTSLDPADAAAPGLTQPVAYVAREIIPASSFSQDDPSTWTAPVGGNATTGQTLWMSATLVLPKSSYLGNTSVSHCGSCHFADGRDLEELNYSNWSIRQRSIFHGLTEQNALDIAAYIRGLSATAPSIPMGRPYNPIYQPAPGLDAGTLQRWMGGAGWKSVNVYDNDSALNTSTFTNWVPSGSINERELAVHILLPDWNHWLPQIYPGDYFPAFNSSGLITYYNNAVADITAGNLSSYAAYDSYMSGFFETQFNVGWMQTIDILSPDFTAGYVRPSLYNLALYSNKLWFFVKQADISRNKGFEGSLDSIYTALYGTSANGYFARGWYASAPFQSAPHFQQSLSTQGIMDQTQTTWDYLSFASYQLALIINTGNRRGTHQFTGDWGYQHVFQSNLGKYRPDTFVDLQVLLIGPQAGADWTTLTLDTAASPLWYTPSMGGMGDGQDQLGQQFVSATGRSSLYTQLITNWTTAFSKYTLASWQSVAGTCCSPHNAWLGSGSMLDGIAFALPVMKTFGVNATLLTTWANDAHSIYPARDFVNTDLAATCTWSSPVSTTFPQCTNAVP